MFVNRLSRNINFRELISEEIAELNNQQAPTILPQISTQSLYQAATAQAYRDYQLNLLFNAEFYGDHGSGI